MVTKSKRSKEFLNLRIVYCVLSGIHAMGGEKLSKYYPEPGQKYFRAPRECLFFFLIYFPLFESDFAQGLAKPRAGPPRNDISDTKLEL